MRIVGTRTKMQYYLGGYYLIELEAAHFGSITDRVIFTCSTCINNSFLDSWSLSWTEDGKNPTESRIPKQINKNLQESIQQWSDDKFESKEIGWPSVFSTLKLAKEYYNNFFKDRNNLVILGIFFPKSEAQELISYYKPSNEGQGAIGLYQNLLNLEIEDNLGTTIGYDFIGVENGGDFHTFHCHDLENELKAKFNVEINDMGLIDFPDNWDRIVEYFNDENNRFEPTPWFFVKVKQYYL